METPKQNKVVEFSDAIEEMEFHDEPDTVIDYDAIKRQNQQDELEVWDLGREDAFRSDFVSEPEIDNWQEKIQRTMREEEKHNRKKLKRKPPKKSKKKLKTILAIVIPVVVVLLLAGLVVLNVYKAKNQVSELKSNAEYFLNSVKEKNTEKSEDALNKLCASTQEVDKILNGPLCTVASIIPKVKKELNIAKDLVKVAIDAEKTLLVPLVERMHEYPLTELKIGDGFNTNLMNCYLDFLEENQEYIEVLINKINDIDDKSIIGGYVGKKKAKINELVASYHEASELIPLLRTIIGDGSDRLYLLVAQNSAEIRASGGFPGSMGTIKVKDGVLTIGKFKSVYDTLSDNVSPDVNIDYEDYRFGGGWLTAPRDICFIPEFPKPAKAWALAYRDMRWEKRYELREAERQAAIDREQRKAEAEAAGEVFEEEIPESDCVPDEYFNDYNYYMQAFHVDGVISMTPAIIQMMLEDVGELELFDGTKLDATNATRVLQHEVYLKYYSLDTIDIHSGWYADELFAETAKKAMKGFLGNFEISKFPYYYQLFRRGIDNHIINIWMEDPEEEKIIEEAGAAGHLNNDPNNPFTGIYFSLSDANKLGWYVDIIPEIGEPVENEDGSRTYDVKVTLRNNLSYDEARNLSWYIVGTFDGSVYCYVHFVAPAGGYISNAYTSNYTSLVRSTYHGLQMAYSQNFLIDPLETIEVHYQVTTAPGVTTPLTAVTTPTLTQYRE